MSRMERDLYYVVFPEENVFVARCLDVEVTTDGTTEQAAVDNLREALEIYFDSAVIGTDRQISLTPAIAIPPNQQWLHTPGMRAKLAPFNEWATKNHASETNFADIES